jgi:murein DD-endopeptidase MepM/ murein hydrolase activator NlpD
MKFFKPHHYFASAIFSIALLGAGCASDPLPRTASITINSSASAIANTNQAPPAASAVILPIVNYVTNRTVKRFGQYVHDRFTGYHTGDDVEVADKTKPVPVYAIADGKVRLVKWASGYGGVMVVAFQLGGKQINAIYGHLKLSSITLKVGDKVVKGQTLATLGDDRSHETDGERKHLHFGLYEGAALKITGYVATKADLNAWIDPQTFFTAQGIGMK